MSGGGATLSALGLMSALAAGVATTTPTVARSTAEAPAALARAQIHPDNPTRALAVGAMVVAARRVADPNFAQTVVLLFAYSTEGSGGLIVNRPSSVSIARVLPDLPVPRSGSAHLFFGGPVSVTAIRALLQAPVAPGQSRQLLPGVHLLVGRNALDEVVSNGATAARLRVYAGYAGWGPGQLEREISRGDWHVFDGDAAIVFDEAPETLWERQIRLTDVIAV